MRRPLVVIVWLLLAAPAAAQVPDTTAVLSPRQQRQYQSYQIARLTQAMASLEVALQHARTSFNALHAQITRDSLRAVVPAPLPPVDTVVVPPPVDPAPVVLPAFPGAEGYGATALAVSRSLPLRVHFVTTNNASGPGSLAAAVAATDSRYYDIIIFRTGGLIRVVPGEVEINASHVYIAGQTAPSPVALTGGSGELIRIRGSGANISDVVIRYLRFRGCKTCLLASKGERLVLDHNSFAWASEYLISLLRYTWSWSAPMSDVLVQRNLFGEVLAAHPTAVVMGATTAMDSLRTVGARNFVYHSNLSVSNDRRSPLSSADNTFVANNVIHNWNLGAVQMQHRGTHDVIGNYGTHGPLSRSDHRRMVLPHCDARHGQSVFAAGNVGPAGMDPAADQWRGDGRQVGCYRNTQVTGQPQEAPVPVHWERTKPQAAATIPVTVRGALTARESVLADVGANARLACDGSWVPALDAVDARLIREAREGTGSGPITALPELPTYPVGTPCLDQDNDGLPDAWEQRWFNCTTCADPATRGRNGYLLIEHYLNGIAVESP